MSQLLTNEVLAGIHAQTQVNIELMIKNTGEKITKTMALANMGYTQEGIDADRANGVLAKQLTDTVEAWVYEYIDADWAAVNDNEVIPAETDVTFRLYFGEMEPVIEETKLAHEWLENSAEDYNASAQNISLTEEAFEDCLLEWRNSQFDFSWQVS